ncbi:M1 family metallopeptidase [Arthrobacter sp. CDRTa11]|uniref:M1 family metallopeptidase n=1 Tax=Arthrobacter sp. CDRTa11 TaxID=2651199 RepID=UPI002265CBA5|nr:M1 family metallopeptidase [Arthrobacter sp. CDRTa11]UZX04672.1 M1 family metallopeptidase [Arthrobacter sp. CDRTa11]
MTLPSGAVGSVGYDERVSRPLASPEQGRTLTGEPLPDSYTPGHGSPDFSVSRYELYLDYRVATNRLDAHVTVAGTAITRLQSIMLNLSGLRVIKVRVDGKRPARFIQREGRVVITPAAPLAPGSEFSLDIRYEGRPGPLRGNWGDVGWEELTDGVLVAGQPTGAPSWFPCNDHPSRKASFGFTVTTDMNYQVVCNGTLVSRHSKASRETWVYEQAEPMATYLATVQIGRYEIVPLAGSVPPARAAIAGAGAAVGGMPVTAIPATGSGVRQLVAAPTVLMDRAQEALVRQREMMATFETCFGPYPFHSYTVVVPDDELEIPLEAQSLSIIGRNHLDLRWESQRLIAHELAHQWFGNSLTASSWKDIWLHEGFACYAEWLWSEASGQGSAAARAEAAWDGLASKPQDLQIGDPGPELMFDDRVYKRGALALHALRTAVGDVLFFGLLRAWTERNCFGSVSTGDLTILAQELCGSVPGFDAEAILRPWLYESLLPQR